MCLLTKQQSPIILTEVIPAGSEYYEDETGLCVSNQIIVKDKV